jgi:uncharacterized protein (DUF362 family)
MSRRTFVPVAAGLACSCQPEPANNGKSPVAVLKAPSYNTDIAAILTRGAQLCGLEARGKRVLIKPNLVEFDAENCINTDVAVLAAAVELLERLGAAEIVIGEGPGHRRDTLHLAEEARYRSLVPGFNTRFVDLNLDEVAAVSGFPGGDIYLSKTALTADLIVSLPKMKSHHWVGATLSMKNFFGVVPGAVYGWPKNWLHYVGIHPSIAALQRIFRRTFAIVDGIIGMEGNGPIQGRPKQCGVIVMGSDLVAVDSTCCRIMGIDPLRIDYIRSVQDLGNIDAAAIDQRGELLSTLRNDFDLMPEFRHLRLT